MDDIEIHSKFSNPTRQSYVAILLILWNIYKRFFKAFWVILLPIVLGKGGRTTYYLYILIGIASILALYSVFAFFKYKFHTNEEEFIVEKGVFSKKRIVIPFDRIQSINFKQNIVQQIFNVVGLEIDTAGTSKKEFDFNALDIGLSKELRDYIFANKKQQNTISTSNKDNIYNVTEKPIIEKIINLEIVDLLKIGLTQNHFRSLIFAFLSLTWIFDQARQAGIDTSVLDGVTEDNILQLGLYMLGGIFILAIIAIIIVSIVRVTLKYFNFIMLRIPNGFKLEYGLFNRNEISVMDNKMQVLIWTDNLLRKALGIFNLQIKLASSAAIKRKTSIIIPGIFKNDISRIRNYYFPDNTSLIDNYEQANIYYLYRRWTIVSIIFIIISIAVNYLWATEYTIFPILLMIYYLVTSYLRYSKMYFGINHEALMIHSGIFGDKHTLLFLYKLQGVELSQSYIQNRKGLSDVIVYSASGNYHIRYIDKPTAVKLRDYILYRIERDDRAWM